MIQLNPIFTNETMYRLKQHIARLHNYRHILYRYKREKTYALVKCNTKQNKPLLRWLDCNKSQIVRGNKSDYDNVPDHLLLPLLPFNWVLHKARLLYYAILGADTRQQMVILGEQILLACNVYINFILY